MTWYSLEVHLDSLVEETQKIQNTFQSFYLSNNGKTNNMALFSRRDGSSKMSTFYFTPNAKSIADIFNATPCERPPKDGLGLLVGDETVYSILFI